MFILVMQFLWKYIDELVGKDLEVLIILELLFYAAASLVPMALPLAVLLSSIMTFGNLGEYYELTAVKSAGISLLRFMRPLIVLIVFISVGAFLFSNFVLPHTHLKFYSLLYDVREQKPALDIKAGIFYNGISGYVIKINEKELDNQTIHGITIWDHTQGKGDIKVVTAQHGRMYTTEDKRYLVVELKNGKSYEETQPQDNQKSVKPHLRTSFEKQEITFDLMGFKMQRTEEELFSDYYAMMNVSQLARSIDSMRLQQEDQRLQYYTYAANSYAFKNDTVFNKIDRQKTNLSTNDFLSNFDKKDQKRLLQDAINTTQTVKSYADMNIRDTEGNSETLKKYIAEWHRKFTLSVACIVLFFIGCAMGAIIRKGGLGMPMLLCIVFFILYYVISMTSEKSAIRSDSIAVSTGMWMSTIVLTPLAMFFIYKANNDSKLFDADAYKNFFKRLGKIKQKKSV